MTSSTQASGLTRRPDRPEQAAGRGAARQLEHRLGDQPVGRDGHPQDHGDEPAPEVDHADVEVPAGGDAARLLGRRQLDRPHPLQPPEGVGARLGLEGRARPAAADRAGVDVEPVHDPGVGHQVVEGQPSG